MSILKTRPTRFRGTTSRGLKDGGRIVRDGGDSGAGLIVGVSVITRGEALGHEMWIDEHFLRQTTDALNDRGGQGIKSRFTHPDMSSDGLGSFLGRFKNGRMSDSQVFADLHFSETAHDTPDGDLASYVMDLAENDPDMFGASIVFRRDVGAEDRFRSDNTDKRGQFKSPDRDNAENMQHARLAEIRAGDIVDEPAANPAGAFHRGNGVLDEADALLSFATGLSDQEPELVSLEFDPLRVRSWLTKWLSRNAMQLVPTGAPASEPDDADEFDLERFRATGDPDIMLEWIERQHRKESDRAIRDVDAMAARVCGSDREAADRQLYG